MSNEQRRAAELLARHPNLHIRDYVGRARERYALYDGDRLIHHYDSPPDAEAGICEYLGQPVPDHIRRLQIAWSIVKAGRSTT